MNEIRCAAVIGAGLMGHGIAQLFAQAQIPVYLTDSQPESLEAGLRHVATNLKKLVSHGFLKEHEADEIHSRVMPVSTIQEAVKDADFVTECVTEDLALKQNLFEELEELSPPWAILASNTSSLILSEIGARVKQKSRMIVTHYFNPPHIIPTVEIVPSDFTDPAVTETTRGLITRMGKFPICLKKALPGFLVNRVQAAIVREVLSILEDDFTTAEEMDQALRGSIGFRMAAVGPLEVMDFGGLDTWLELTSNLLPTLNNRTDPPAILVEKVTRGDLGVKSGRGFYDWGGGYTSSTFAERARTRDDTFLDMLRTLYAKSSL
jgi:3-hydroxybutyryl-CoA dehydrogenase